MTLSQADASSPSSTTTDVAFVAINYITCQPEYRERFETLFRTRAGAIDRLPGFRGMQVLAPEREGGDYLVVSQWTDRASFDAWRTSPEFAEGHKRGFEDLRAAREAGRPAPMSSRFETYGVLCR